MYNIKRNASDENRYSEWMRTKNGELAFVSVRTGEKKNGSLFAYAYAHSILTFFRRYDTDDAAVMNQKTFSETILEHIKYASQKLDFTLGTEEKHPLPFVSGVITVSDGRMICFTIGDGAVSFRSGKKYRLFACSCWSRGKMKKYIISGKKLPLRSVRITTEDKSDSLRLYSLRSDANIRKKAEAQSFGIDQKAEGSDAPLQIFRAVVTGRRHASRGQYCQDYADYAIEDTYAAAALSDGAGGGSCSEYGALMNVNTFLSCCKDDVTQEEWKETLLGRIQKAHEELTAGKPEDAIQAYATMMGVCLREDRLTVLHIGDGMVFGRRRDGSVECISDAENYYVSNRTFFTIEPDASDHLYIKALRTGDYDRLLMMTDGVYNGYPASDGENRRMDFIRGIFEASDREDFDDVSLAGLIDTEQVLRYGDDHSAILIRLNHRDD